MSTCVRPTKLYSVFVFCNKDTEDDDLIPDDNAQYKKMQYWDARFAKEETYDWLCTFPMIQENLEKSLNLTSFSTSRDSKDVLIVGCGNSTFSFELARAAPSSWKIISTDYSSVLIDRLRIKYPGLCFELADMTQLTFPDNSFDFILDKAAMDALVSDEGSAWEPSESSCTSVNNMVQSCARVLKPGGKFVLITFQPVHFRRRYLERAMKLCSPSFPWDPTLHVIQMENPVTGGDIALFTLTRQG